MVISQFEIFPGGCVFNSLAITAKHSAVSGFSDGVHLDFLRI